MLRVNLSAWQMLHRISQSDAGRQLYLTRGIIMLLQNPHTLCSSPLRPLGLTSATLLGVLGIASAAMALPPWSDFGPATAVLDTANSVQGGCPIESRDGKSLYMASPRSGGQGDLDIWVAHRAGIDSAYGLAENLPTPVNSASADFCPTPIGGKFLLFVSARSGEDACGAGDMYLTRNHPKTGWEEPLHLGCAEDGTGPNTAGGEFSPSLVEVDGRTLLYFSSTGYDSDHNVYVSEMQPDGSFAPGEPVVELNTEFDDRMPSVSKDGLEVVFASSRPTWGDGESAFGSFDIYYASRESINQSFSEPVNLGPGINTAEGETRSSFSWDRTRVLFGRSGEIYVTEREKLNGKP